MAFARHENKGYDAKTLTRRKSRSFGLRMSLARPRERFHNLDGKEHPFLPGIRNARNATHEQRHPGCRQRESNPVKPRKHACRAWLLVAGQAYTT